MCDGAESTTFREHSLLPATYNTEQYIRKQYTEEFCGGGARTLMIKLGIYGNTICFIVGY